MPNHFIIKGYHWGYNDETYYPEGGFIHDVYTDKKKALDTLIRLERRHWRRMDLNETHVLFDGEETVIKTLNDFMKKKLGTELNSDSGGEVYVPSKLSDEDFLEFLDIADLRAYKIIESDDQPEFCAIWVIEDEQYLTEGEDESLIFGSSIDELKTELDPWSLTYLFDENESLQGALESLSTSPQLLQKLITSNNAISYEDETLFIDEEDLSAHFAVNELLESKIFEIRKLSLEEIRQLQGYTPREPKSEIEDRANDIDQEKLTDLFLNAATGVFKSNQKKSNVDAAATDATEITEQAVSGIVTDVIERENALDVDGMLKHFSGDAKIVLHTTEGDNTETTRLNKMLFEMTLKITLTPACEYHSEESIDRIDITGEGAAVHSSARASYIDPIENSPANSTSTVEYQLRLVEGKLVITHLEAKHTITY